MAICKVLLISEQEVKNLTDISDNVDVKKFCHWIPVAQDKHVKTAIGESCYSDLLDGVENANLTADEVILLDGDARNYAGIKSALAWWVLYYSYPNLHSTVTPTGIVTKDAENTTTVATSVLTMRRNGAKVQAEHYTDQAICFICENSEDYPCTNDADCCIEKIHHGYGSSGIVVEDSLPSAFDIPFTEDDLLNLKHRKGL